MPSNPKHTKLTEHASRNPNARTSPKAPNPEPKVLRPPKTAYLSHVARFRGPGFAGIPLAPFANDGSWLMDPVYIVASMVSHPIMLSHRRDVSSRAEYFAGKGLRILSYFLRHCWAFGCCEKRVNCSAASRSFGQVPGPSQRAFHDSRPDFTTQPRTTYFQDP